MIGDYDRRTMSTSVGRGSRWTSHGIQRERTLDVADLGALPRGRAGASIVAHDPSERTAAPHATLAPEEPSTGLTPAPDVSEAWLDDFREDEDPADVDAPPQLVYGSVDEFVREYLRHMYTRPVAPGNARYRWDAEWWRFHEAVARIEGLCWAWEHLRQDPATGSSTWWAEHADDHMPIVLRPDGPFARSKDSCEPGEPGEPLPYTAPPAGWFRDMRGVDPRASSLPPVFG